MAQAAPQRLYDGFTELSRGQHSGKSTRLLTRSHLSSAVNTTFRGDMPHPRPGWKRLVVSLSGITGKYQGGTIHQPISGDAHLLLSIGGHIYAVDVIPATKGYHDITGISGDYNSPSLDHTWFAQTPGYTVIQNAQSRALIYNGSSLRRANPAKQEVPFGSVMAYGNGRLWVALPDRRSYVASDLIYGPSGTSGASYRDSCLRFTEAAAVAGGGSFGLPLEAGEITAMKFAGTQDTSTGQGPLLVGTEGCVISTNVPMDRLMWSKVTYPLQTIILPNGGPTGPFAMASVNGDVWYRTEIGLRSVQNAYRDFGTWTNSPLSRPVRKIVIRDDPYLLEYASLDEFDNRLLATVTPQRNYDRGIYHLGLVALDFDQISDTEGIGGDARPVWEGLWTGLKIMQIIVGKFNKVKRCFAVTWSDDEASFMIWELTKDALWDEEETPIKMELETPEYGFGAPADRKELKGAKLWLRDVSGAVALTAKYAPDGYPVWQTWDSMNLCAEVESCGLDGCYPVPKMPQVRNPIVLPEPAPTCLLGQALPSNVAYSFAARLEITGQATVAQMRMEATPIADDRLGPCAPDEACVAIEMCETDPFSYVLEA